VAGKVRSVGGKRDGKRALQGDVELVGDAIGESREDLLETDAVGLGDVVIAQREEFVDEAQALVDEARRVGAAPVALLELRL